MKRLLRLLLAASMWSGMQTPALSQTAYKPAARPGSLPDLQGVWTNETATRLERAPELGERLVLTPAEALAADNGSRFRPAMRVNGEPRSSLITEPSNGRVPPLIAGATPDPPRYVLLPGEKTTDGPELQAIDDRCILPVGYNAGPVILPLPNNSNYQIIQTAEYVVIVSEMIHDARIVRLGGRHRTDGQRPYLGDSIGWWEGDTLVVETTNFPPEQVFKGAWRNLKITERFSRTPKSHLLYRFRVEDPTKWAGSWGGEYEFRPADASLGEYACREGEVSLPAMLLAARRREAANGQ